MRQKLIQIFVSLLFVNNLYSQIGFVQQHEGKFTINNKPYFYIGTNYWYGIYLPLLKDKSRGIERLKYELDFLKIKGVTNLRILAGSEGSGRILGNYRVGPALQTTKGVFDTSVLFGLDVLLNEMSKRNMKAVIFFSNNWEWSGGFLQYLNWNGLLSDSALQNKMEWEEMRDQVSKFYSCEPCKADYLNQVDIVLNRINSVNKRKYVNDPTIMSWELVNEPRPMRPSANNAYKLWIKDVAAHIKSKDKNHLVCLGHEGEIGTQNFELYSEIHSDSNVDYLTIHIWPKNWGWVKASSLEKDYVNGDSLTMSYIKKHIDLAKQLQKPLVIEEFGFPRDDMQFTATSPTNLRDKYYRSVLSAFDYSKYVAGINFWAFNGKARPIRGQVFWKPGNDYLGDPPMEEQSLYGVFDSDNSTWKIIESYVKKLRR